MLLLKRFNQCAYNNRSQILTITDYADTGNNRTYGYDGVGRLETASGTWGSGSYNYDAVGNLTSKSLGSRNVGLTYNGTSNRLTSVADSAVGGRAARSFAYDTEGDGLCSGIRLEAVSRSLEQIEGHCIRHMGCPVFVALRCGRRIVREIHKKGTASVSCSLKVYRKSRNDT